MVGHRRRWNEECRDLSTRSGKVWEVCLGGTHPRKEQVIYVVLFSSKNLSRKQKGVERSEKFSRGMEMSW